MNTGSLWQHYHAAMLKGDTIEAQRILRMLQSYKGNPTKKSGCSSCSRRFYNG